MNPDRCKRGHLYSEVGVYEGVYGGRYQRQCKKCAIAAARRRAADPEVRARRIAMRTDGDRAHSMILWKQRRYGLSRERFLAMAEAQKGLCAICDQPETANGPAGALRPLSIDHDHETGEVRGLLCNRCNRALGLFLDDLGLLTAAIDYLRPWFRPFPEEAAA